MRKVKAIGLISGGLDSTLAAKLMLQLGVDVLGLNFHTGFCLTDHRKQMKQGSPEKLRNEALRAGNDLNFPVETINIAHEYLQLVTNPRYGYGKNANPCIDCRIMMLKKAKIIMEDEGADFIFTGEVLGQRPMTQMRGTLRLIEKRAGLERMILRPLSAKLLPVTIPEEMGLIDRSKLKDFHGRSRKPQLSLAGELGVTDFPQPAGGCCFLTDPGYSRKFFDLLDHRQQRTVNTDDFTLLKVGRHLRVKDDLKVVVGRNESENSFLRRFTPKMVSFEVIGPPGPLALMEGDDTDENRTIAAQITARYSDAPPGSAVKVKVIDDSAEAELEVIPIDENLTDLYIIR
ncbi:hypothetical protein ISS30_01235 [bacterium]|nr:hypothetical protein [bacterium]